MHDFTNVNTTEKRNGLNDSGSWMRKLPVELEGVMPESAWLSLSREDKLEILRRQGKDIFEKYLNPSADVTSSIESSAEVNESKPTVNVENANTESLEKKEFASEVSRVKEVEKEFTSESVIVEDKQRIEEETAKASNTGLNSSVKVFGYSVSQSAIQNANTVSDSGDVSDGGTWAATLIKKILAIFG